MPNYRRLVTAIVALMLASACSGPQPAGGVPGAQAPAAPVADNRPKILTTMLIATDLDIFDPMFGGSQNFMWVDQFMYDGLVRYAPGRATLDALEPDLAEKWQVSPDGLQWTFTLRKGVMFHKGFGELTSADVKYSFDRQMVKGSGGAFAAAYNGVKSIETPDPSTVRFVLGQRDPFFLTLVANYGGGFIVSKAAAEKYGKDFRNNPVGTGAFQMKEYRKTNRIILERHDGYFKGTPKLNGVEILFMPDAATQLLAFKAGELRAGRIDRDLEMIADLRKAKFEIDVVAPIAWSAHFNPAADSRFADMRVRQAFAYCTDRTSWAAFFGDIATPSYLPGIPEAAFGAADVKTLPDALRYAYNPERGKQLLAQAGFAGGFEITIPNKNSSVFPAFGQIAQEQWKKCGINLKIRVVDNQTYDDDRKKAIVPLLFDGGNRVPIADIFLREWFYSKSATTLSGGIKNHAQYGLNGQGIDGLLDQARAQVGVNDAEAVRLYRQAQTKILEDLPAVPLITVPLPLVRSTSLDLGYKMVDSLVYNYQITEKSDLKR